MTDPMNVYEDPKIEKAGTYADQTDGDGQAPSMAEIYDEGIRFLEKHSYHLEPDVTSKTAYHYIYHFGHPVGAENLQIPAVYKCWRKVLAGKDKRQFQNVLRDWIAQDAENRKAWQPFIKPDPSKRQPMYGHAMELVAEQASLNDQEGGERAELGIDVYPQAHPGEYDTVWKNHPISFKPQKTPKDVWKGSPRAFIPLTEWFPERVRVLTRENILTLWPRAEQEILSLIIGRLVVGPDNSISPSGNPINHTSRMCALVLGEDPGLGKSTFFGALWKALTWAGYKRHTFGSINSRFNMAKVATSDIIEKDDISPDELKKFVSSANTKIIITGTGKLETEEKGVDAIEVKPIGTIFMNSNEFNPRYIFDMDPGIADRIKVLSTWRTNELEDIDPSTICGSPNAAPREHLKYLADLCDTDEKTIMLWLARLCADKFLAAIQPDPVTGENILFTEISYWDHQLRMPLLKNASAQVISLMMFCSLLGLDTLNINKRKKQAKTGEPIRAPSINWYQWLQKTCQVLTTEGGTQILASLKYDFENTKKPSGYHPYLGAKYIGTRHTLQAYIEIDQSNKEDANLASTVFEHLRLDSGMPLSKDLPWINKSLESVRPCELWLIDLYTTMYQGLSEVEELGFDGVTDQMPIKERHQSLVAKYYKANFALLKSVWPADKYTT